MPCTFTQGNLEDTAKHVERQNQEANIFTRQINTSIRQGGEQNTQDFFNVSASCLLL